MTSYVAGQLGLRPDAFLQDLVGLGCGAAIPCLRAAEAILAAPFLDFGLTPGDFRLLTEAGLLLLRRPRGLLSQPGGGLGPLGANQAGRFGIAIQARAACAT